MSEYYSELQQRAKQIRAETAVPTFTDEEKRTLLKFFSNTDKNTFFVFGLPEELTSTLISMYSRLKNPRGLRGLFLDSFIKDIPTVADLGVSPEARKEAVSAKKIKDFMRKWLDKYGHNSIARTGVVHVCFEKVSVMAAKAIEEGRPGAGYLELSTRYVDMSAAGFYPVGKLFNDPKLDEFLMNCLNDYTALSQSQEEHFKVLAAKVGIDSPSEVQLQGKVGDHVGNILPCAVYTSVGATLAGEAFQRLMNHLLREQDPECDVLAQEVLEEAEVSGASVLLGSYYKPSKYEIETRWKYMDVAAYEGPIMEDYHWPMLGAPSPELNQLREVTEASHQKLNREYEMGSATFSGVMSFRSWRDLHRQGFCTHFRSVVAPNVLYIPPDVSMDYFHTANDRFNECKQLYQLLAQTKENIIPLQKLCPMGAGVGYRVHGNLRQWEFVTWQRSKQAVHHEVRTHIIKMYDLLCQKLPWWKDVCRCNHGDYLFSRGATLPSIDEKVLTPEVRYPWKRK